MVLCLRTREETPVSDVGGCDRSFRMVFWVDRSVVNAILASAGSICNIGGCI